MPKKYPPEMRARALALAEQGRNSYEIARELSVPQPTTFRWIHPDKEAAYRAQKMHAQCPVCGGKMREGAMCCRDCRDGIETLRKVVVQRYLAGQSAWAIALEMDRDPEWATSYINALKKKGVLPRMGQLG